MATDATARDDRATEQAAVAHVVPFIVWIVVMSLPGIPPSWLYALQSALAGYIFVRLRPWQWYSRPRVAHLGAGIAVGLVVAAVWIVPELRRLGFRWPNVQVFYLRYCVDLIHFGKFPTPHPSPYAPEACGWPLSIVRVLGSAFVIAVIEEFFWRGFLYRWIQKRDFFKVSPATLHLGAFLVVAVCFGLEHDRWVVGIIAGLIYGYLYVRSGNIWAVVAAHVTTNLVLGLHVLITKSYYFW